MALKIDLCRITNTRQIPWKDDVNQVREGQALERKYDGGKEVVQPSAATADSGFVGVAFSTETAVSRWPKIEALVIDVDGTLPSLSERPADNANRLAIFKDGTAVTVSTDGSPGADEIDVTSAGVITLNSSTTLTDGTYTFVYEYEPSAAEVRTLQGDLEPGAPVNSELGSNGVITEGDVFTTEWDVEADWDDANAAHGVRMTSDGRFTTGTATSAIPNVDVIQYPNVDQEFLGLRLR